MKAMVLSTMLYDSCMKMRYTCHKNDYRDYDLWLYEVLEGRDRSDNNYFI